MFGRIAASTPGDPLPSLWDKDWARSRFTATSQFLSSAEIEMAQFQSQTFTISSKRGGAEVAAQIRRVSCSEHFTLERKIETTENTKITEWILQTAFFFVLNVLFVVKSK